MANFQDVGGMLSLRAASDLSTKQFYAVKLDTNGRIAVAGAGEFAIGILYSKPNAIDVIASVAPFRGQVLKGRAGDTFTAGVLLAIDADGELVTAAKGTVNTETTSTNDAVVGGAVVGVSLEAGVDNQIVEFLAYAAGAVATTAA